MYQVTTVCDDAKWDDFVRSHAHGHLLQLSAWAGAKAPLWSAKRLVLCKDDEILAGAQLLFRRLPAPLNRFKICYIPRGPLVDWNNRQLCTDLLSELIRLAQSEGAINFTCDPAVLSEDQAVAELMAVCSQQGLTLLPHNKTMDEIQPRFNMRINLTADLDTIKKNFSATCRSQCNKAAKQPFKLVEVKAQGLDDFFKILQITGCRDQIGVRNQAYYDNLWQSFSTNDQAFFAVLYLDREAALEKWQEDVAQLTREIAKSEARLTKLSPEKQANLRLDIEARQASQARLDVELAKLRTDSRSMVPLACAALLFDATTCHYLYGGSSDEYRFTMPVYALLPQLIAKAKARGCTWFDFGGVSGETDPAQDERHGGLYIFKRHFGCQMYSFVGEYAKDLRPWLAKACKLALRLRARLRHS